MAASQKLLYSSVVVIIIGVFTKLWLFGAIVRFGIKDQVSLKKSNEVRAVYLKLPFPLNFKLYFFNVTNPQEIQNGEKPIVNEVGPYWYDEFKEKVDVVDNETEDSLTYTPYDLYQFNQNKSGSLRDDDYITIIHPVIVGMVNIVMKNSPVFLSIVNQSLEAIFNNPKTIFFTGRVKDLLFDGIDLNCTSSGFAPKAICSQLKTQIPGIKYRQDNENIYLFSMLGPRNASHNKRLKVLRGISYSKELGRLIEVDGEKEVSFWSTSKCNSFDGTDGWIFPPLLAADEGLKSYSTDLCRNMKVNYVNDTVYKKIHVRYYETNLGDQSTNAEEKCYCPSEDICLKKGVFDMTKCMGVPLYATLPHFLYTDESYIEQLTGLRPDPSKHSLGVLFEPMTGTPLFAAKRMQFNYDLNPTTKVALFSKLPSLLFPIFWLEESIDLEGDLLKKLQTIFLLLFLADIFLYLLILFGVCCLAMAIYFRFKNRNAIAITSVTEARSYENPGFLNNDMKRSNKKAGFTEKMENINHALTGHEFDRY
ncbi:sensory neuron membrane protein 1-like [Anthonomus grandis grandis]|uniref:sensory neuron membrane protein 1-like n=1 Tax=Anthonomus grandis grandis TaxID=2921223 RepID=UPI0021653C7F|nr:sensory neuron membrane protein 1-like [Anthonomus grandis grandis]